MMRPHCPSSCATAEIGYAEPRALIEVLAQPRPPALRHHPALRAHFMPRRWRSPGGCSASKVPGVFLQSHLAENRAEAGLGGGPPWRSYLDVYERAGQLPACARCSHTASGSTTPTAGAELAERGAAMSCPTSNLFLGSGLRPAARAPGVGLGTDRGGRHQPVYVLQTLNASLLQLKRPVVVGGERFSPATPGRRAQFWYLDDRIASALGKEWPTCRPRPARPAASGSPQRRCTTLK